MLPFTRPAVFEAIAVLCLLATTSLFALAEDAGPRVFAFSPESLLQTRKLVAAGDPSVTAAMKALQAEADEALRAGPFSVVTNGEVPPSGDPHDYMSVGPYWWPDPNKPDGLPYIRRDGEVNPDWYEADREPLGEMSEAVETLALAYYLTGEERYAEHAARLLRAWFLDEATRMNPHLQFGQGIPGRCTGRGIGLIDTARWVGLIDAIGLLQASKAWTEDDQAALVKWFDAYLTWTLQSKYGQDEARTHNNHATWYDAQVASYALFVGRTDVARKTLQEAGPRRIATQIEPDGRQPHELARTKSWSYSTMNLRGMFQLAALAERVDVDLWNFRTDDGRGIRTALDWLVPFATGEKKWAHRQISEVHREGFVGLLLQASTAYEKPSYARLVSELPGVDASASRDILKYTPLK